MTRDSRLRLPAHGLRFTVHGLLLTAYCSLLTGSAGAQTTVPQIGQLPPAVRSAGMGGTSVSLIGYAGSVFTNPAGLGPVRVLSLEGAGGRIDSSTYLSGSAAMRLGKLNLGGGIRYLRFDAGNALLDNVESAGAITLRVMGVALGAGGTYHSVEDSAGQIRRMVTGSGAITLAFFDIMALAFSARNLGEWQVGGDDLDLPTRVAFGFNMNLVDTYSNWRLLAAIERSWTDGEGATHFGLEGGAVVYGVGVVARVGSGGHPDQSPFSNTTVGASLVLGRGALDYAYLDRPGRSPLHLFGLRWTP